MVACARPRMDSRAFAQLAKMEEGVNGEVEPVLLASLNGERRNHRGVAATARVRCRQIDTIWIDESDGARRGECKVLPVERELEHPLVIGVVDDLQLRADRLADRVVGSLRVQDEADLAFLGRRHRHLRTSIAVAAGR